MIKIMIHSFFLQFVLFLSVLLFTVSPAYAVENAGGLTAKGIEKVNSGDYAEAEMLFLEALRLDDSIPEIYFELGRLSYFKDECASVDEYLSKFKTLSDDEGLIHYSEGLMESCREDDRKKSYSIDVALGAQYDSNAIVEPDNPAVSDDRKKDSRFILFLKGSAELFNYQNVSLAAEYSLYQSQHARLNNYNMQHHKFEPVLDFHISDSLLPSIGYSFEHTKVDKDKYSNIHKLFAELLIIESDTMSTELRGEYNKNKYWDSQLYQTNSDREGDGYSGSLRQNIIHGRLSTGVFLKGAYSEADMDYWSYGLLGGGADVNFRVSSSLSLSASAEYEERSYDGVFPATSNERIDKMQDYTVELTYMVTDRIAFSISDTQTVNDSNLDEFAYSRNIASLFISVGVL